jgi:hypothetical protein
MGQATKDLKNSGACRLQQIACPDGLAPRLFVKIIAV